MNTTFFSTATLAFGPVERSTANGVTYTWRSLHVTDNSGTHRIDFHGAELALHPTFHPTDSAALNATLETQ